MGYVLQCLLAPILKDPVNPAHTRAWLHYKSTSHMLTADNVPVRADPLGQICFYCHKLMEVRYKGMAKTEVLQFVTMDGDTQSKWLENVAEMEASFRAQQRSEMPTTS